MRLILYESPSTFFDDHRMETRTFAMQTLLYGILSKVCHDPFLGLSISKAYSEAGFGTYLVIAERTRTPLSRRRLLIHAVETASDGSRPCRRRSSSWEGGRWTGSWAQHSVIMLLICNQDPMMTSHDGVDMTTAVVLAIRLVDRSCLVKGSLRRRCKVTTLRQLILC
jgi:hypothetical protein